MRSRLRMSHYRQTSREWRDPAHRDRCESAFGDQGKSTQLKSVIHGRCYLREEFEFSGVTPLLDFIHVLCYFVMFVYL